MLRAGLIPPMSQVGRGPVATPLAWVLDKVCFHEVVEDVVFTDPLHGTAAGGTQG